MYCALPNNTLYIGQPCKVTNHNTWMYIQAPTEYARQIVSQPNIVKIHKRSITIILYCLFLIEEKGIEHFNFTIQHPSCRSTRQPVHASRYICRCQVPLNVIASVTAVAGMPECCITKFGMLDDLSLNELFSL